MLVLLLVTKFSVIVFCTTISEASSYALLDRGYRAPPLAAVFGLYKDLSDKLFVSEKLASEALIIYLQPIYGIY